MARVAELAAVMGKGIGISVSMRRTASRELVDALDEVDVINIGLNVFPARFDAVVRIFLAFGRGCEAFLYACRNRDGHLLS
jgi:hypothetical protein